MIYSVILVDDDDDDEDDCGSDDGTLELFSTVQNV
jgi:hypothetical protein